MTSKPRVQVNDRDFHELTRDVVDALVEVNSDDARLFTLGSTLTRLGHTGGTRLIPVDKNGLRNETRGIEFVRVQVNNDGKSTKPASPPMGVLANILAEPSWPFPPIERVVHVPVFAPDGTVMTTPGFHKASLTYFAPLAGATMMPLPAKVESGHLIIAAHWLSELLGDFPFLLPSDRAHAIAAMILPFVRNLINGPTPLHLISAPTPGTGKTRLAKAISIPAVGPHVGTTTQARNDEEWRKKIGAALSGGPMVVLWDNVSGWVGSPQLNAVLTTEVWQDRRLGKNDEELHLPNQALWVMTSNNANLSEEVARRTIPIRLDAQTERPADRHPSTFKYPYIDQWASEHRNQLIWSVLVMGQAWVEAGRPPGRRSLGSFESWASVIGGILDVTGVDGFLATSTSSGPSSARSSTNGPSSWRRGTPSRETGRSG